MRAIDVQVLRDFWGSQSLVQAEQNNDLQLQDDVSGLLHHSGAKYRGIHRAVRE
ncbi:MAG: hypothetical protein R3E64_04170 [Halioglobus sp.]